MQQKHLYPLLVTLALLTVLSCSKESTITEVNGFVADATNLTRLPGVKVFLKKENSDCFSCQGTTIAMETANANGMYAFKFEHEKGFIYRLAASHDNYWDVQNGPDINKGEENTKLITLSPKAYLRVFLKNVNPFDGNDAIGLNVVGGGGYSFYGMAVDTFVVKEALGNQNNPIAWFVTKNNIQTSSNDEVYCPAFDTTNYTINY